MSEGDWLPEDVRRKLEKLADLVGEVSERDRTHYNRDSYIASIENALGDEGSSEAQHAYLDGLIETAERALRDSP